MELRAVPPLQRAAQGKRPPRVHLPVVRGPRRGGLLQARGGQLQLDAADVARAAGQPARGALRLRPEGFVQARAVEEVRAGYQAELAHGHRLQAEAALALGRPPELLGLVVEEAQAPLRRVQLRDQLPHGCSLHLDGPQEERVEVGAVVVLVPAASRRRAAARQPCHAVAHEVPVLLVPRVRRLLQGLREGELVVARTFHRPAGGEQLVHGEAPRCRGRSLQRSQGGAPARGGRFRRLVRRGLRAAGPAP
mmetsp:Transcript_121273/g.343608  ORF Transcript_121273/g.343608 Transcript_121273/m.343608 type:complete len:250 (-) Transcript_121273:167-916(-)